MLYDLEGDAAPLERTAPAAVLPSGRRVAPAATTGPRDCAGATLRARGASVGAAARRAAAVLQPLPLAVTAPVRRGVKSQGGAPAAAAAAAAAAALLQPTRAGPPESPADLVRRLQAEATARRARQAAASECSTEALLRALGERDAARAAMAPQGAASSTGRGATAAPPRARSAQRSQPRGGYVNHKQAAIAARLAELQARARGLVSSGVTSGSGSGAVTARSSLLPSPGDTQQQGWEAPQSPPDEWHALPALAALSQHPYHAQPSQQPQPQSHAQQQQPLRFVPRDASATVALYRSPAGVTSARTRRPVAAAAYSSETAAAPGGVGDGGPSYAPPQQQLLTQRRSVTADGCLPPLRGLARATATLSGAAVTAGGGGGVSGASSVPCRLPPLASPPQQAAPALAPSVLAVDGAPPELVDRSAHLARPLQLHEWQKPAALRQVRDAQREAADAARRLRELQAATARIAAQEAAAAAAAATSTTGPLRVSGAIRRRAFRRPSLAAGATGGLGGGTIGGAAPPSSPALTAASGSPSGASPPYGGPAPLLPHSSPSSAAARFSLDSPCTAPFRDSYANVYDSGGGSGGGSPLALPKAAPSLPEVARALSSEPTAVLDSIIQPVAVVADDSDAGDGVSAGAATYFISALTLSRLQTTPAWAAAVTAAIGAAAGNCAPEDRAQAAAAAPSLGDVDESAGTGTPVVAAALLPCVEAQWAAAAAGDDADEERGADGVALLAPATAPADDVVRQCDDHAEAPTSAAVDDADANVNDDADGVRRHFAAAARIQAVARGASARRLVDDIRLAEAVAATAAAAAAAPDGDWQAQDAAPPDAPVVVAALGDCGADAHAGIGSDADGETMEADSVAGDAGTAAAAAWLSVDALSDGGGGACDGAVAGEDEGGIDGYDAAGCFDGDLPPPAQQAALPFEDSLALLPPP